MDKTPGIRRIRLGVIVPSSNTVMEPLLQKMVAGITDPALEVTVHFARFRVTKIELSQDADAQFTLEAILAAAELLADAKVHAIGWGGTSASWLGFSTDEALCENIERRTGIPATTSVLAMNNILQRKGARNVGLVTPYLPELNTAIQKNYQNAKCSISDERSRCAGLSTNFDFAALQEQELDAMVDDVVQNGAETILVMCTNVAAAQRAKHWEGQHQLLVLDSVATVLYGMLQKLPVHVVSTGLKGWGSIFDVK